MELDVRSTGNYLAISAWVALRAFVGTVFVLTIVGVVLASISYYFLREHYWVYGVIAGAVALVESVSIGFVLGTKRAIAMAAAQGLGSFRLGQSFVRLVFERMLGVSDGTDFGARDGRVARVLERLPLAQTSELLNGAIRDLTGEINQSGWLRRKIQKQLLEFVRKYDSSDQSVFRLMDR